jgi:hypothetical protein
MIHSYRLSTHDPSRQADQLIAILPLIDTEILVSKFSLAAGILFKRTNPAHRTFLGEPLHFRQFYACFFRPCRGYVTALEDGILKEEIDPLSWCMMVGERPPGWYSPQG